MSQSFLTEMTSAPKPVFGMLHLPALPGSPRYRGETKTIIEDVLRDAEALLSGGVSGFVMENFFDIPFFPMRVPHYVVAHVTRIAQEVRTHFDVPLGVNVLRNDSHASLAVAHAVGAAFIRINILAGARVTDQGLIEGVAHELLRERAALGAQNIKIFADVHVKHSTPLGRPGSLEDEVSESVERAGADAVIITGRGTGLPTDSEDVMRAQAAAKGHPVIVGSGVGADSIRDFAAHADGFIIGTAFKRDGVVSNPVDPQRVKDIISHLA